MYYHQDRQNVASFTDPSLFAASNEEPPFNDQFMAYQHMQDREHTPTAESAEQAHPHLR